MIPAGIVGLEGCRSKQVQDERFGPPSRGSVFTRCLRQWTEILFIQLTVDEQRERDSESRLRARHGEFCDMKSSSRLARNEDRSKGWGSGKNIMMAMADSD